MSLQSPTIFDAFPAMVQVDLKNINLSLYGRKLALSSPADRSRWVEKCLGGTGPNLFPSTHRFDVLRIMNSNVESSEKKQSTWSLSMNETYRNNSLRLGKFTSKIEKTF